MSAFVAALPMYDWPESRAEVDAQWDLLRREFFAIGIDAPERLVRRNGDLPPVPGGIRDGNGAVTAPDPATLDPDALDLPTLWRHPNLLFAQTCWGPMLQTGLAGDVDVVGQPDYSDVEGGAGTAYSSVIIMAAEMAGDRQTVPPPADGSPLLPIDLLRGARFAFNEIHSLSGRLAIKADLEQQGEALDIFSEAVETGGHRLSIRAIADGRADVAAIDCRSWALARRHEPAAATLRAIGWTGRRTGLPFIASKRLAPDVLAAVRRTCARLGP